MGCGPSNSAAVPVDGDNTSNGSKGTYPPPEAFEIPLDVDNPESLIKKHPPKRLKRLEERPTTPKSIEDLEEKLATAEMRRQQFLASRCNKTTTIEKAENGENADVNVIKEEDEGEGEEDENLEDNKTDEAIINDPETGEEKSDNNEKG
ncbi:uncharacterized protein LOC129770841 [Toxorhynchites rutilus septentrionalis]|uniref:uncharacterized protein LOC129770841 n=1 Tax=Toxorhynchites rutilus septentrionalis TaxID=329112 RepID=UPI00247AD8CE|nr:uncharacterized protein LOC129770841 [Toxorhynchites rutilus septentrionalis]